MTREELIVEVQEQLGARYPDVALGEGSNAAQLVLPSVNLPSAYFEGWYAYVQTGNAQGLEARIKTWDSATHTATLLFGLPIAPSAGDKVCLATISREAVEGYIDIALRDAAAFPVPRIDATTLLREEILAYPTQIPQNAIIHDVLVESHDLRVLGTVASASGDTFSIEGARFKDGELEGNGVAVFIDRPARYVVATNTETGITLTSTPSPGISVGERVAIRKPLLASYTPLWEHTIAVDETGYYTLRLAHAAPSTWWGSMVVIHYSSPPTQVEDCSEWIKWAVMVRALQRLIATASVNQSPTYQALLQYYIARERDARLSWPRAHPYRVQLL